MIIVGDDGEKQVKEPRIRSRKNKRNGEREKKDVSIERERGGKASK
jgi:hypothetical protein